MATAILFDCIWIFCTLVGLIIYIAKCDGDSLHSDNRSRNAKPKDS